MDTIIISRIIIAWVLFISICLGCTLTDASYYSFGPNSNFIIMGVKIDTMNKYILLCIYTIINVFVRNMNHNIISPWIIQNIQNNKELNIKRSHIYEISICYTIYGWIDWIIFINIILSQFDIVVIEILSDIIINAYITRNYIISKQLQQVNPGVDIVIV